MNSTTTQTAALLPQVNLMITGFAKRLAAQSGGSVEAADLTQVGLIAALRCIESYDASKGASFRTYCRNPVLTEMQRTKNASRSVTGGVTRCAAKDISFSALVGQSEDSDETFGDLLPSDEESIEVQAMKAEREAKVREIVARVRKGWKNKELFDDLLNRLMTTHFAGERFRSEIPLTAFAEKHGMSRQGIHVNEKRVREVLTHALATIEEG
jgi:RNA polymerase sigma factor (sigma-70 family)